MLSKVIVFLAGLIFYTAVFADTGDIVASNNQIGFQTMSTYIDYTETGNGRLGTATGTLDTETGAISGFALSVSAMDNLWMSNDYIEAEYDYSSGNTIYTGSYQGGVFGSVVGTSGAIVTNLNVRYGKGLTFHRPFMLTPYVEFGQRYWDRGVNYGEIYTHEYIGIGVLGQFSPVYRLVLSVNAMIGRTFGSYITVISGPGLVGFSGALGNSSIYRAGFTADYAITQRFHGNVTLDYMSFSYGISDIYPHGSGKVAWEPDSQTNCIALRLGVGYGF